MPVQKSKAKTPAQAKPSQPVPPGQLEIIPGGDTRLLLIAPHGYPDDENPKDGEHGTADIVRRVQAVLGGCAIINETNPKTKRNLNSIDGVKDFPEYTDAIREAVKGDDHTLVVFVHGAEDEGIEAEAADLGIKGDLTAVIGYGQPNSPCANEKTAESLIKAMSDNALLSIKASENRNKYCAADDDTMTQWFGKNGFTDLNKVEAIQIEFKDAGVRDEQGWPETADKLTIALSNVTGIQPLPYPVLVNDAFDELKRIFQAHFHEAMLNAGRYIIKKFYGNDYESARNKKPFHGGSLRQLVVRLQQNEGHAPSKTWVYDAVNLAVDEHALSGFRTYGNIGHSQKVLLTHVSDTRIKKRLIEETAKDKLTVARLRKAINDTKPGKIYISFDNVPADETLAQLEPARLKDLRDELTWHIADKIKKLKRHKEDKARVEKVIEAKPKDKRAERNVGFRDWTEPACNVNIQTGCANGCRYCYAKILAYKREQKELGSWADQEIRPQDVDKHRHLYHGLVGFPSTHDIRPENLDDYLHVLGKLLRAGNEVLIVSKPRLECIQRICEASSFFKDKILFRFTIGAMDNALLEFWEPNAPTYEERKDALKFAYDQGFRTSVSIEPMLDAGNVVALVDDLAPLVSEDIWIGKMNHTNEFGKGADEELREHLAQIETAQTDERLTALHKAFEGRDNVKWKTGSRPEDIGNEQKASNQEKAESNKRYPGFKGWPKVRITSDAGEEPAFQQSLKPRHPESKTAATTIEAPSKKCPPFNPKMIFVQKKVKSQPLQEELRERFPNAVFKEFEGDHRKIPDLMSEGLESRFLKTKTDTLILAERTIPGSIVKNPVESASDFMFNGLGWGCLFGCVYCYTNLHKMRWHKVSPLTLWANIDALLANLVKHQARQNRKTTYEFSCNNDSIAEGNFFSSTTKFITTIAQTKNAYGVCDTKATDVDYLLDLDHNGRITILMTLNPPFVVRNFEFLTGSIADRVQALNKLANAGYKVGITFSPIILRENWLEDYASLFQYIDKNLTYKAKTELFGQAFFYSHRPLMETKLPAFKSKFEILHNEEKFPVIPKGKGCFRYRDIEAPIESFKISLKENLPYLKLEYIQEKTVKTNLERLPDDSESVLADRPDTKGEKSSNIQIKFDSGAGLAFRQSPKQRQGEFKTDTIVIDGSSKKFPPFNPKFIFVQKKAKHYPLYGEVRERFPNANFEEFEGDHRKVEQLKVVKATRFLKSKRDTLILAVRGVKDSITENPNGKNSDFIFAGIGFGCLFGCAYCYTNLNKLSWLNVAPYTLYANFNECLGLFREHQKAQTRPVLYDFSCNNDSIAEGAFFSSTAKLIEAIGQSENANGICTTKATNVDYLLNLAHNSKTTIKITVAPPRQIRAFEYYTGGVGDRVRAVNELKKAGYGVGLNFSPLVLRKDWLAQYIELFQFIDANLTDEAKDGLIGEAFFYTHRKILPKKLPMFRKQFEILHNPDEYPTKPKKMGVHHYRNLEGPIEDFKEGLKKYLPYFQLRYIF